jgi:DNA-3-methyladenine glycosylase
VGQDGAAGLLPREFFCRPAQEMAPGLLGCVLESELDGGLVAVRLTEVEAYAGQADPASHAYRGQTRRNAVMFGEPGHAYVYFTYGMYFCVNLVCLPEGTAAAVLLRAGAVLAGAGLARRRRTGGRRSDSRALADRDLARGPARLCQALGVDRSLDGADVCDRRSPLRIRPAPATAGAPSATAAGDAPPGVVLRGPRVGVSRAATVPWRFWLADEPTVSAYRAYTPRPKPSAAAQPGRYPVR